MEEDTPAKVAQRLPEVPVYEPGTSSHKPGYYRASILHVGETYQDVATAKDKNRYSSNISGKYTSFDKRKAETSKRPLVQELEANSQNKKKKKSGINQAAQIHNTADLRDALEEEINQDMSYIDEEVSEIMSRSSGPTSNLAKPSGKSSKLNDSKPLRRSRKESAYQNSSVAISESESRLKSFGAAKDKVSAESSKKSSNLSNSKQLEGHRKGKACIPVDQSETESQLKPSDGTSRNKDVPAESSSKKSFKSRKSKSTGGFRMDGSYSTSPENLRFAPLHLCEPFYSADPSQSNDLSYDNNGTSFSQKSHGGDETTEKDKMVTTGGKVNTSKSGKDENLDHLDKNDNSCARKSDSRSDLESPMKDSESSYDSSLFQEQETETHGKSSKAKRKILFDLNSHPETGNERSIVLPEATSKEKDRDLSNKKRPTPRSSSSKYHKNLIDSTDSEFETGNKKYKIDPDYTPRKYEDQKFELAIKEKTIQKLRDLNIRHQEKVFDLEDKIRKLETENWQLNEKIKGLNQTKQMSTEKQDRLQSSKKLFHQHSQLVRTGTEVQEKQKLPAASVSSGSKTHSTCQPSHSNQIGSESSVRLKQSKSSGGTAEEPRFSPLHLSEPSYSDHGQNNDLNDESNDSLEKNHGQVEAAEVVEVEAQESIKPLLDGVERPPEIWSLISNIKSGEKGDLRFIKDLAVVGFGPETLAGSSIKGTKRGHKKDGEPVRPPLDETMLKQIHNCLVERVQKEVGGNDKKVLAATNPRLAQSRYYSALRQAQKKFRGDGYGINVKTDSVTLDVIIH